MNPTDRRFFLCSLLGGSGRSGEIGDGQTGSNTERRLREESPLAKENVAAVCAHRRWQGGGFVLSFSERSSDASIQGKSRIRQCRNVRTCVGGEQRCSSLLWRSGGVTC